ncbi:MAG: antibiotic biosynthesis monooxygenase [Candidatus Korobacteraceae bacterium]
MFARNVSLRLKPNTLPVFTKTFEEQILPMLRKEPGFQDAIVTENEGIHVMAISLWDSREHADGYEKSTYPQVLKSLEKVLDGQPKVRVVTVVHSTSHQLAAAAV